MISVKFEGGCAHGACFRFDPSRPDPNVAVDPATGDFFFLVIFGPFRDRYGCASPSDGIARLISRVDGSGRSDVALIVEAFLGSLNKEDRS